MLFPLCCPVRNDNSASAVGWGCEGEVAGGEGVLVGGGFDGPAAFVDMSVVALAEQDEVVGIGVSVVSPPVDVVGVATGGVGVAVGELAVLVALDEGSPLAFAYGALGASGPEDGVGVLF